MLLLVLTCPVSPMLVEPEGQFLTSSPNFARFWEVFELDFLSALLQGPCETTKKPPAPHLGAARSSPWAQAVLLGASGSYDETGPVLYGSCW